MSEYSAEELLRLSKFIKDMQSVLGGSRDDNDDDEARAWDDYEKASSALAAYAKRIKTDESATPVAEVYEYPRELQPWSSPMLRAVRFLGTAPLPIGTKLFAHPPAQAAQVEDEDMDAQLTVMIEHLTSIVESQAAEPVAQDDCRVCGCVDDGQCLCTRPRPADSRQVPDGWVLVPREPTTAILEALESTQQNTEAGSLYNSVDCWEAMLEAAIRGKPS
jgi:hypothetical protein